ncbi:MAG: glutaminase [Flavobacteriales bacterium]|nr:glutaminase [Flavobacteriia bacterium]NCP06403.1 glutaminase [Flavobacteriales bacterium]PIV94919.1 MAG: glutaminase [Flavobacteriaceae bacterium CG17_big_fil_post_rev_8_21_14_2_50_33_15]PIY09551.1 MAG: glutaminase [Flavobacteriaceae bacterium CG_4_10_14_3_um_filter_33_47]PJB17502.1 MAG: glutaminase [Flavobacteriaceae bacterium CG_4_9_14_3_um_filter_33_16]
MRNFQPILKDIYASVMATKDKGTVASYIPELAIVDKQNFGIHLRTLDGYEYAIGNYNKPFSIQSISKVLSLTKATSIIGNNILKRVGVEPSGHPFNQLALLEIENGIPRNPFINAGAIVIADILVSRLENPKQDFLNFVRGITNDVSIHYNESVAHSEKVTGFKNYAAANLLKSFGNLENDVEVVLDFYFHQCSIEMSCSQLSKAFFLFANKGKCLQNVLHLTESQIKRINALMLTCGFYDEAGEFAFEVGLPGKSGVGGGIVALLPNNFIITTWSPGLNINGNSKLGMHALEQFTTKTQLSIF